MSIRPKFYISIEIMVCLSSFEAMIIFDVESSEKFGAIRELIAKASNSLNLGDLKWLEKIVIKREKLASTACGHSVAFAHGKTDQVDDIIIILGVSRSGISFGSPDGKPVNFLFLIISPPKKQLEYLMVLSSLARIFHDDACKENIMSDLSVTVVRRKMKRFLKQKRFNFLRRAS